MPAFTLAAPPHPTSGSTFDATVIWLYFNERRLFMCAFLHVFTRCVYVVLCTDILISRTRWFRCGVFVDRFLVWACFPVPSGGIVCFLFQK